MKTTDKKTKETCAKTMKPTEVLKLITISYNKWYKSTAISQTMELAAQSCPFRNQMIWISFIFCFPFTFENKTDYF